MTKDLVDPAASSDGDEKDMTKGGKYTPQQLGLEGFTSAQADANAAPTPQNVLVFVRYAQSMIEDVWPEKEDRLMELRSELSGPFAGFGVDDTLEEALEICNKVYKLANLSVWFKKRKEGKDKKTPFNQWRDPIDAILKVGHLVLMFGLLGTGKSTALTTLVLDRVTRQECLVFTNLKLKLTAIEKDYGQLAASRIRLGKNMTALAKAILEAIVKDVPLKIILDETDSLMDAQHFTKAWTIIKKLDHQKRHLGSATIVLAYHIENDFPKPLKDPRRVPIVITKGYKYKAGKVWNDAGPDDVEAEGTELKRWKSMMVYYRDEKDLSVYHERDAIGDLPDTSKYLKKGSTSFSLDDLAVEDLLNCQGEPELLKRLLHIKKMNILKPLNKRTWKQLEKRHLTDPVGAAEELHRYYQLLSVKELKENIMANGGFIGWTWKGDSSLTLVDHLEALAGQTKQWGEAKQAALFGKHRNTIRSDKEKAREYRAAKAEEAGLGDVSLSLSNERSPEVDQPQTRDQPHHDTDSDPARAASKSKNIGEAEKNGKSDSSHN